MEIKVTRKKKAPTKRGLNFYTLHYLKAWIPVISAPKINK